MKEKLRSMSIMAIVIHSMVGITLLTLPRDVIKYAGNSAWISILLVGVVAILDGLAFYWIASQFPGLNLSEINEIVLGKIFGKVVMLSIGMYVITSIGLSLRLFTDSVRLFLLDKTPSIVVMVVMLGACLYCIKMGMRTISIVYDLLVPLLVFFIALLFILSLTRAEPEKLLPVFHTGILPIIKGSLQVVDPFLATGIIAYVLPYFCETKDIKKWILIAIASGIIVYALIIILCLMVLGKKEITYLIYPTLSLSKSIRLRTQILERAESLFMAAWIPNAFTTILSYYIASSLNLKALFKTKSSNLIFFIQIPIFIFIALLPKNTVEVFQYLTYLGYLAQILNFGYLPIFLVIVFLHKRKDKFQ